MPSIKQKKDHYEQDYKPGQDCDQEDSDVDEPEYKPTDLTKHFRKLRNKKASLGENEPAAETSGRLRPPPEKKQATPQTVGSDLVTPPNVVRCKNTDICKVARERSDETKTTAICRCNIKVPKASKSVAKTSRRGKPAEAWFESILPAKTPRLNTTTIGFTQLLWNVIFGLLFWLALIYATIQLLRQCGYNVKLPHLPFIDAWIE